MLSHRVFAHKSYRFFLKDHSYPPIPYEMGGYLEFVKINLALAAA